MLRALAALAVLTAGCGFDWDRFDPRLETDAGSGAQNAMGGSSMGGNAQGGNAQGGNASGGAAMSGGGGAGAAAGSGGTGGEPNTFCDEIGLVACYRFEDNADDGTAAQRHFSADNVSYVAGIDGKAIQLGASSLVSLIDSDGGFAVSELSIEAWVKVDAEVTGEGSAIIDYQERWGLFIRPTALDHSIGNMVRLIVPFTFPANEWVHLATTADEQQSQIFVNGVLLGSGVGRVLDTVPYPDPIMLGANSPLADEKLTGTVDGLRIFARVRTAQEICAAAAPACP